MTHVSIPYCSKRHVLIEGDEATAIAHRERQEVEVGHVS